MSFLGRPLSAVLIGAARLRRRGRIFLSFADPDREQARRIAAALRARDFDVFFDEDDLPPGGDFNARIEAAMARSDAAVFLLSPDFLARGRYALAELAMAEAAWPTPEGRVLAVALRPVAYDELPAYLSTLTVLAPAGPPATEVAHAVDRLRGWTARRRWRAFASLVVAALAGVLVWAASAALERQELATARASVAAELRSNTRVVADLKGNAESLGKAARIVAEVVRHPGIKVLAALFPHANLDHPAAGAPDGQASLYAEALATLTASGLTRDATELQRAAAACRAITSTIASTRGTLGGMADPLSERYVIEDERWRLHRDLLLNAEPVPAMRLAEIYDDMHALRRDYARIAAATISYLDAMDRFCGELKVDEPTMKATLAAERLAFDLLLIYLESATAILEKLAPELERLRMEAAASAT